MDLVVVTYAPDIKLLRHFLASYDLYYASKDRLFIVASEHDSELLHDIDIPSNAEIIVREDYADLRGASSFSQQLYFKLAAYQFVTTEHFCIMDSDFLFIGPTSDDDFFFEDKPIWFYRSWIPDEPPLRWRSGTEKYLKASVEYNYADVAQYVFKRSVCRDLAMHHDLTAILGDDSVSEFLVYAWFAHQHHAGDYVFARQDGAIPPIVAKVNQVPPDYCHLDSSVRYADFAANKCVAFWSHWELAETKMIEFFEASQREHFGSVHVEADRRSMFPLLDAPALSRGDFATVEGAYTDGWLKEAAYFRVATPPGTSHVAVGLDIPANPSNPDWALDVQVAVDDRDDIADNLHLLPGERLVRIRLPDQPGSRSVRVRLSLGNGFRYIDNPDEREFRARLKRVEMQKESPWWYE